MNNGKFEEYVSRLDGLCAEVAKKVGSKLEENLDYGITPQQFLLLKILKNNKHSTPSFLAEHLNVNPSAITAILERMMKSELLKKEKSSTDKRTTYILLTAKGEQKLLSSEKKRQYMISNYLTKFTEEELEQIVAIYEKFNHILEMEANQ